MTVGLITEMATEGLRAGSVSSVETLDNELVHVPGKRDLDNLRRHRSTQNDTRCKTYKVFLSGVFHLVFSDCS